MRKKLVVVALLLSSAPPLSTVGSACGDKFLLVGRSARFNQAYAAIYPATILLYASPGRIASPALLDPKFQSSLTRAGHRFEVVKDEGQALGLLSAGRFDLVLADVTDVEVMKAKATLSASQPTVMPVLLNPTRAEVDAVRARYQCDLQTSDRPARYLARIDQEMQTRIKSRAARKPS